MAWYGPPRKCPGTPVRDSLRLGQRLFRVHRGKYPPLSFNPTAPSSSEEGGRFDCLRRGAPAFLYAGESFDCAVAETFLRDVPLGPGPRVLTRAALQGRMISELEAVREVPLLNLQGASLGQVGQDVWLTKCGSQDYEKTRRWGEAMRGWAPWAGGFVWRSRRDEDLLAYVLFDSGVDAGDLRTISTRPVEDLRVLPRIERCLARHNVAFFPVAAPER
jgi:hypothetical protein